MLVRNLLVAMFSLALAAVAHAAPENSIGVRVTTRVVVYDVSDPTFTWGSGRIPPVVTDPQKLKSIDRHPSTDAFSEYFGEGPSEAGLAKFISGGELSFEYDASQNRLLAVVTYSASRIATGAELAALAEYTRGQLLDGIGEGFTQSYAHKTNLWVEFDAMNRKDMSTQQVGTAKD